jgi:DEAD/DEAH box helicase domain-containing protein
MTTVNELIDLLTKNDFFKVRISHIERLPAQKAKYKKIVPPLPAEIEERLSVLGIKKLYSHQVAAIKLVRKEKNVIIVTGTASGKSLCYNLPVMERKLADPKSHALYIYPTKALAQDQLRMLKELHFPGIVGTYDGDTPLKQRRYLRNQASIILTNPDMLHYGILPHHKRWANFFHHLEFIVIDEAHALRGVFGSNVALIIRRLRRLVYKYRQKEPVFILCSATIANPGELATTLTGLKFEVVSENGAPQGEKIFILWEPPTTAGKRRSSNIEAAFLLSFLAKLGLRTIAFCKSRKVAELLLRYTHQLLKDQPALQRRLSSYRAGYLPEERRQIEAKLARGELLGVSTTTALELGIDIGSLDAAILNGFPGTIASTWQQAGRAGRKQQTSIAVLIAADDPLDQYYIKNPSYFFGKSFEAAIIDPKNQRILEGHLTCAAYEAPITLADTRFFDDLAPLLAQLTKKQLLVERKEKWFKKKPGFPAKQINVRSISQDLFSIINQKTGELLATTDSNRAFFEIHPGAIYLHQGECYLVKKLHLDKKIALVEKTEVEYYTEPREETEIAILDQTKSRKIEQTTLNFGYVSVTSHITAYQKRHQFSGETLATKELNLPPQHFKTEAIWLIIPDQVIKETPLDNYQLAGAIHAIEHAAIALLPAFVMCDRWDVGGVSTPYHNQTGEATIFIYDGYEEGIGISERAFEIAESHLTSTLKAITFCKCENGCPSCIQSPKCGNWNEPLDKKAAIKLLKNILNQ